MKNTKRLITVVLAMMIIFTMSACAGEPGKTEPTERTFVDAAGREVTIKQPIETFVINNYDLGESLAMVLGDEYADMVTGTGIPNYEINKEVYEKHFPQLKNIKSLAGGRGPYDLEALFKLEPDVFFMNSSENFRQSRGEEMDKVEQAGIPVYLFFMYQDAIQSPRDTIRLVGEVFGREERAKEVTDFIDAQFNLVEDRLANIDEPVTFYYERDNGMTSAKGGWTQILNQAGGQWIAEDIMIENSGKLDPETVLVSNPDFIVLSGGLGYKSSGNPHTVQDHVDKVISRPGWKDLDAIKNKRLFVFAHDFSRSPLSFYPVLYMAKEFYPERMADVDPDAIMKEFYDKFMIVDYEDGTWSYRLE